MGYSRKNTHTPTDGKLEILAGGGVDGSEIRMGGRNHNIKILPQGSLLTLTSINIFQPLKKRTLQWEIL